MKVTLGKILKPQGIKGEVKVLPLSNPDFFKKISLVTINNKEASIESASVRDGFVYIKFDCINDRNTAESYRDAEICAEKDALPDLENGQFYYDDLIGCQVYYPNGELIGEIIDIQNYGNADIFEIHKGFSNILCPYIDGVFTEIDTKKKRIVVDEKRYREVTEYDEN